MSAVAALVPLAVVLWLLLLALVALMAKNA